MIKQISEITIYKSLMLSIITIHLMKSNLLINERITILKNYNKLKRIKSKL